MIDAWLHQLLVRLAACVKRPPQKVKVAGPSEEWIEANTHWFGGTRTPNRLLEFDICISGSKGTGKTTAFRALMASRFQSKIDLGEPFVGLVYSPKPDDFVHSLREQFECQGIEVRTTNPMIESSFVWDACADLLNPLDIHQLATTIVKEKGNEQSPFFKKTTQLLIYGIILSISTTEPFGWRFRQLVAIVCDVNLAREVIGRCPITAPILDILGQDLEVTLANIRATNITELTALQIVASLIDGVPDSRRFSIKQAARTPGVIYVYSSDARYGSTLGPFNSIQFEMWANELLSRGPDAETEAMVFIDEFTQINSGARNDAILKLLEYGRSNRVRTAIAFQTPAQVFSAFGDKDGDTLLGQFHSYMVFRHSDNFGKEFWAKKFSKERGKEHKHSYSQNSGWSKQQGKWTYSGGTSHSIDEVRYELDVVSEHMIGTLAVGTYEDGMFGIAYLPTSKKNNPMTNAPRPIIWTFHLTPSWCRTYVPTPGPYIPYEKTLKPDSEYKKFGLYDWEYDRLRLPKPGANPPAPTKTKAKFSSRGARKRRA